VSREVNIVTNILSFVKRTVSLKQHSALGTKIVIDSSLNRFTAGLRHAYIKPWI